MFTCVFFGSQSCEVFDHSYESTYFLWPVVKHCSLSLYLCIFLYIQVELPPPDLGPTASLTQTLSLLREVLASHDSSVLPLDARQADFAQVQNTQKMS